jgi:hypothetical protein
MERQHINMYIYMKGGKLFGKGSNGIILGEPRIACSSYDYPDDNPKADEISKLPFNDYYNEIYSGSTSEHINKHFPNKTKLLRYFLLPEKECFTAPITKATRNIYTDKWFGNNGHLTYDDTKEKLNFNGEITSGIRQFVYKKADKTLEQMITETKTVKEAKTLLKKTIELYEGLSYVHSKKFFHNDIKLDNVMTVKGVLKFVDTDHFVHIRELFSDVLDHNKENLFYIGFTPLLLFLNTYNIPIGDKVAYNIMSVKLLLTNDNILSDDTSIYCRNLIMNFIKMFISISYSSLQDEQKNSMRIMLNRVLNHYMYGLYDTPKYRIEMNDTDSVISEKLIKLYSDWTKIIGFRIAIERDLTDTKRDVGIIYDEYDGFFKENIPELEAMDLYLTEMSKKTGLIAEDTFNLRISLSYQQFFGVSNDVCGYCFMLLQICEELFKNIKYASLQPFVFDVFMMSTRLISESIEGEIENVEDFIRESGANMKRLLRVLEEDEEECRDGRCAIMGGRKTRRGKKKQHKTRRVRRTSRSRR